MDSLDGLYAFDLRKSETATGLDTNYTDTLMLTRNINNIPIDDASFECTNFYSKATCYRELNSNEIYIGTAERKNDSLKLNCRYFSTILDTTLTKSFEYTGKKL